MYKAKIFRNGQSQAVRLPKECRFIGKEVGVIRLGNSIVLQPIPQNWKTLFNELKMLKSDDIKVDREDLLEQQREELE